MLSRLWIPGALAAAVVLIGCSESSTATPRPTEAVSTQPPATLTPQAATPTATVGAPGDGGSTIQTDIQSFTLEELTVQVGDTIVWTQQDAVSHTTTSGTPGNSDGVWDSGFLNNGQTFSFTFTEAGTFPYFCTIHPSMTATVTVAEAGSAAPSPTATPPPTAAATATGTSTQTPPPTAATATATQASQPAATATPVPTPTTPPPPIQGETIQSTIQNFRLEDLTVQVGDTVVWTQQDQATHTTTSGLPTVPDGVWDSGFLNNGQTFSLTLTETGTFPYYCAIHPSMRATVTVTEAGSSDTESSPPEATPAPSGEIDY